MILSGDPKSTWQFVVSSISIWPLRYGGSPSKKISFPALDAYPNLTAPTLPAIIAILACPRA
jgi:hypothetical protein